jgi:DNA-binding CsgD family transcriptional regulator
VAHNAKYREWLELLADLMTQPLSRLPGERLALALCDTFDSVACSYTEFSRGALAGGGVWPSRETLNGHRDEMAEWVRTRSHEHPLICFFSATRLCLPMQIHDVPHDVVGRRTLQAWKPLGESIGSPDQLSLPLRVAAGEHRAFVLGRTGPYTADELALANLLWRLLIGLDRQVGVIAHVADRGARRSHRGADVDLTPREVAVLALLADGLTAGAIARRLVVSTRTVDKHLQHIYSKLRVADRLTAVLRAREFGLVDPGRPPAAAVHRPGRTAGSGPHRGGTSRAYP